MINKRAAVFWAIVLVIVTAFSTFIVTNTIAISLGNKVVITQKDFETIKSMEKLLGLKDYIKKNYTE